MDNELCKNTAEYIGTLATATAVGIVLALSEPKGVQRTVNDLTDELGIPRVNVSKSLKKLYNMGIVDNEPDGNKRLYFLAEEDSAAMKIVQWAANGS